MTRNRASRAVDMGGRTAASAALSLAFCLLWGPAARAAQDTVAVRPAAEAQAEDLPREVAEAVVEFYNRPTTVRLGGRVRIPAQRGIEGDVAVLGGPVDLSGRVGGDLLVINGDLEILEESVVEGDVTVVGGVVTGTAEPRIAGALRTYTGRLRYRRTEEGIVYVGTERIATPEPPSRRLPLPEWSLGESEIYVSGRAYNRIEGLPIAIGPRITTGGHNPLRVEALAVYRSESGFDIGGDDLGYELRARQYVGGHRDVWLEAAAYSVIQPIETWQLTNLENSLSLFLLRRDYRDYYERAGWSALLGWTWGGSLSGSLEYRDERHTSVESHSPWTILFNTDEPFRANARIHAGDLRSLTLTLRVDTRNDRDDPWSGWHNLIRIERSIGGRLADRVPQFTHLFVDLRRYNRVSPGAVLAFRFVGGGRAGGSFLPAQRQHLLGGSGSLPGYDQLQLDCNVRIQELIGRLAAYGCERMALFQAEYRGDLNFNIRWDDGDDTDHDPFTIDFEPDLVFFYNAGAAWNTGDGFLGHLTDSENWVADLGGGLELGGLGLYLAHPLAGSGGFNFLIRVGGRF